MDEFRWAQRIRCREICYCRWCRIYERPGKYIKLKSRRKARRYLARNLQAWSAGEGSNLY